MSFYRLGDINCLWWIRKRFTSERVGVVIAFEGTVSYLCWITGSVCDFVVFLRRDGHSRVRIPGRTINWSRLQNFQIGYGANRDSYSISTGSSFHGLKRPESDVDHLPMSIAEVKKWWSSTSTPPSIFTACVETTLLSDDCHDTRHMPPRLTL